jgi:ABC-type nickel/cobalt efflux system permease component RcnA
LLFFKPFLLSKRDYIVLSSKEATMAGSKWSVKDKLEMAEAVFTIIVSIMAIWGTVVAWENGFWHKIKHIADHLHTEIEQEEHEHLAHTPHPQS